MSRTTKQWSEPEWVASSKNAAREASQKMSELLQNMQSFQGKHFDRIKEVIAQENNVRCKKA